MTLIQVIALLWENRDVLDAVKRALDAGVGKDAIVKAVDDVIIAASDATVEKDLGL